MWSSIRRCLPYCHVAEFLVLFMKNLFLKVCSLFQRLSPGTYTSVYYVSAIFNRNRLLYIRLIRKRCPRQQQASMAACKFRRMKWSKQAAPFSRYSNRSCCTMWFLISFVKFDSQASLVVFARNAICNQAFRVDEPPTVGTVIHVSKGSKKH